MCGGAANAPWQNSEPRQSSQKIYNAQQRETNETQTDLNQEQETKQEEWDCECGNKNTGKYCGQCGKEKPQKGKKCLMCRTMNPENAKFCLECGKPLE